MKYYVTDHLLERLKQRNIQEADVYYCIENYHTDYGHKDKEYCHYYIANIRGNNLKVLVDTRKKTLVTAFWLGA